MTPAATPAAEIARLLADRIDQLVAELLPGGTREGRSWRCGNIAGEAGSSLSIDLAGSRRGLWQDFATGEAGDALDLVRACLGARTTRDAILWSERWLGIAPGEASIPSRRVTAPATIETKPATWPRIWRSGVPIAGTLAERYLRHRGLAFPDAAGDVLRFAPHRTRRKPGADDLEYHPALIALLRDLCTGQACGVHNVYLRPDGTDRLRDAKGKTTTGRVAAAAVMLSGFDDVTLGLTIAEGVETGIAVLGYGLAPVWACCGTAGLAGFPVLPAIECLTVAADRGAPGEKAAATVVQ